MCGEYLVGECVVKEGDDGDVAVGGSCGKVASWLGGRPGDQVDRCGVVGELIDSLPLAVLLSPDEDSAVVGGGCKDGTIFWMRLRAFSQYFATV